MLFTEKSKEEILEWSSHYSALEYARSGFVASRTVSLTKGPMNDFAHSMEPHLRSLGLPTKLEKGVVTLVKDHVVCEKGKVLTPEQARFVSMAYSRDIWLLIQFFRILKLIAIPMATFKLSVKCAWTKEGGFENLRKDKPSEDEMEYESDNETIPAEAVVQDRQTQ